MALGTRIGKTPESILGFQNKLRFLAIHAMCFIVTPSLRGRRSKGKERGKLESRSAISEWGGRERLQGRYCFLRILRPPDEHKNPDWLE